MPVFCLDPVYYDSTPWEFNLVEVDMGLVREYFGDPGVCRMYANDVHKTPCYRLEREPYEFSLFVQLKHSPWMRFDIMAPFTCLESMYHKKARPDPAHLHNLSTEEAAIRMVNDIHRECERNWTMKKSRAAFLSLLFQTRAMLFGWENTGDTLYYELFEKGCWKESFVGGLYESGRNDTFCRLKSEIRPACRPGNDEIRFVEETFALWKIAVPFVSLLPYEKSPRLLKGSLAGSSVFSESDLQGFDCALIDHV